MRQSWTDERLDDFRGEVNRRFDEVDRRFDEVDRRFDKVDQAMDRRFDKVDRELHRVNDRLDSVQRAIAFGAISLTGGMLAGFGGIIALVVAHY